MPKNKKKKEGKPVKKKITYICPIRGEVTEEVEGEEFEYKEE